MYFVWANLLRVQLDALAMGWIQAPAVFVKCPNILPAGVKWSAPPHLPHDPLFSNAPVCVFWVASESFLFSLSPLP